MPTDYQVKGGDCISSIAYEHGFFWETLWNHALNAELKSKRKDPNILKEGDVVHLPDMTLKEESGATEKRHRFTRKGIPSRFRLRLLRDDQPMANKPFELSVDGHSQRGTTDGDGRLDLPVPPNAHTGILLVGKGADRERFELSFGHIDPLDSDSGMAGRLGNLGFMVEPDLPEAIRGFQAKYGLPVTGDADEGTRDKIREIFGE